MPIEPWWETHPSTTPRQELGMVSTELTLSAESAVGIRESDTVGQVSLDRRRLHGTMLQEANRDR